MFIVYETLFMQIIKLYKSEGFEVQVLYEISKIKTLFLNLMLPV